MTDKHILSQCSKFAQKEYKWITSPINDWVGEGHPLGFVLKIEIWPYEQVLFAQPRIHPGE